MKKLCIIVIMQMDSTPLVDQIDHKIILIFNRRSTIDRIFPQVDRQSMSISIEGGSTVDVDIDRILP